MNTALYIAKRYLFTPSSNNAINIITLIAGAGVVIGSAALFIVLSGFSGLKDFSLQFSVYADPDLKVMPTEGKTFVLNENQKEQLDSLEGLASYSAVIEERVVIHTDNKSQIVNLKGVDSRFPQPTIDSIVVQGGWMASGSSQIVAGWGVSNALGFSVMDFGKTIKLYVPKPGKGQVLSIEGAFNTTSVVNVGIFQINEELDNNLVFTTIETARNLLRLDPENVSAVEIKVRPGTDKAAVIDRLYGIFANTVEIKTKTQLNDALYKMLNTEQLAVYLIFTLVLIIALFNVIGSIIMMILDKRSNLSTLFSLGITVRSIRKIFFLQGSLMAVIGGVAGLFLGVVLVFLQQQFALVMITPTLAYPMAFTWGNVVLVLLTITALGVLAARIATFRISRQLLEIN